MRIPRSANFTEIRRVQTSLAGRADLATALLRAGGEDIEIAEYLIGSLNDDGYLPAEIVSEAPSASRWRPAA